MRARDNRPIGFSFCAHRQADPVIAVHRANYSTQPAPGMSPGPKAATVEFRAVVTMAVQAQKPVLYVLGATLEADDESE